LKRLGLNQTELATFPIMQRNLNIGYQQYMNTLISSRYNLGISTVGTYFNKIYDELRGNGENPLNPNTIFSKLYVSDDSHPSVYGTYLAACSFYKTIFKKPTLNLWAPDEIPLRERLYLQNIVDKN
jgi:hypothetical protein